MILEARTWQSCGHSEQLEATEKKAIPQPKPQPVYFDFDTFIQTLKPGNFEKNTFIQTSTSQGEISVLKLMMLLRLFSCTEW